MNGLTGHTKSKTEWLVASSVAWYDDFASLAKAFTAATDQWR